MYLSSSSPYYFEYRIKLNQFYVRKLDKIIVYFLKQVMVLLQ